MVVPTQLAIATRRIPAPVGVAPCALFILFSSPSCATVDEYHFAAWRLLSAASAAPTSKGESSVAARYDLPASVWMISSRTAGASIVGGAVYSLPSAMRRI